MPITIPANNHLAFATNGLKEPIPATVEGDHGKASMDKGFPAETMTSSANSIPPRGRDMNGILHQLSSHQVFLNAGGAYRFDAAYAAKLGGYAAGAVLQLDDGLSAVVSTLQGNLTDPNVDMQDWQPYAGKKAFDEPNHLFLLSLINRIYPVGIIIEFNSIDGDANPNVVFPGTSWVLYGEGKTTVGYSTDDNDPAWTRSFNEAGHGHYTHQLSEAELAQHKHPAPLDTIEVPYAAVEYDNLVADTSIGFALLYDESGNRVNNGFGMPVSDATAAGSGQPFEVVQPSIVVARWCRIA